MANLLTRLGERVRETANRALSAVDLRGAIVLRLTEESLVHADATLAAIAEARRLAPTLVDLLTGRLETDDDAVVLTVDATSDAVIELLLPALHRHGAAARLFVDPIRLGRDGHLDGADLRAALAHRLVVGLHVDAADRGAAELRAYLERSTARLRELVGAQCHTASTPDDGRNAILARELRRVGMTRLYTSRTGLSTSTTSAVPRLTIGADVSPSELPRLLDLDRPALARRIVTMQARAVLGRAAAG